MEILIGFGAWYLVGYAGFVYSWTRDMDLDLSAAFFGLLPAILGPIAFIAGLLIHGDKGSRVLISKRNRQ